MHLTSPSCQAMTYNVGYFFAVTSGLALGYALFFDYMAALPGSAALKADPCHIGG